MVWRVYDQVIDAGAYMAAALMAFIAFGVTIDILARYTLGWSFGWMLEMSEYAMYAATMLATSWVLREGGHTAIDLITSALPPRTKSAVEFFANAVGLATSVLLAWYALQAAIKSFNTGRMVFKTLTFPDWWLMAVIFVGMTSLAIGFLRRLLGAAPEASAPPAH